MKVVTPSSYINSIIFPKKKYILFFLYHSKLRPKYLKQFLTITY